MHLRMIPFLIFCLLATACVQSSPKKPELFIPLRKPNPAPYIMKEQKGLVVIDPGHGGSDFGTQSLTNPKYHEKSLNLVTANFLNTYLQQMGYQTLMTRSTDVFIPLQQRATVANDQLSKIFVSVHYNSAPSTQAHGIEIFYYPSEKDPKRTAASQKLAKKILTKVIEITEAKSRGVKQENFAVIRETQMPAVLIEGGFLTNQEEMAKIKQPDYMKRLAWGIALGIDEYMRH